MADQSQALILGALTRTLAATDGLPLLGARGAKLANAQPESAMFANTAAGRQAAQACKDKRLVRVLRTEAKGKAAQEIMGLTEAGIAFLLEQTDPRPVLEAIFRSTEGRAAQLEELLAIARSSQDALKELRGHAGRVLDRLYHERSLKAAATGGLAERNGAYVTELDSAILAHLRSWRDTDSLEDCPLPDLLHALPSPTIGQFHDCLRRLHDSLQIYLHPWTGPLYEIPEPALALLVGHEIAYYASLRTSDVLETSEA